MESRICLLLIFLFCHLLGFGSPKNEIVNPEVYLTEYATKNSAEIFVNSAEEIFKTEVNFKNNYVSKVGNDYIVTDSYYVIFICKAKYPIKWGLPFPEQLLGLPLNTTSTLANRISEFKFGNEQPTTTFFESFLTIKTNLNFLSATYSCSTLQPKSNSKTTIHIFSGRELLENENKTLTIKLNNSSSVILPYRPSSPDIPVSVKVKDGKYWKRVPFDSISFNPKIGVVFNMTTNKIGLYKCSVYGAGLEERAFVLFNVTKETETVRPLLKSYLKLGHKAVVNVIERRVQCCSGTKEKPSLYQLPCQDKLQCELMKAAYSHNKMEFYNKSRIYTGERNDCVYIFLEGITSLVGCNGKNVEYLDTFKSAFRPDATKVINRSQKWNNTKYKGHEYEELITYTNSGESKAQPMQEKILILVGFPNQHSPLSSVLFTGFAKPISVKRVSCFENETNLDEYYRNVYYEGEPLRIMCFGLKHLYGDGAHLMLNWKNGTKSILPTSPLDCVVNITFRGGIKRIGTEDEYDPGSIHIFGEELLASSEMESVDCFMPRLADDGWDKRRYWLVVKANSPPMFKEGNDTETVYLYLGDKNGEIIWELEEGNISPEINITKDEKRLKKEVIMFQNDMKIIKLRIGKVTKDAGGIYELGVENMKGTATKKLKVLVSERLSNLFIIFICIIPILLCVLACNFYEVTRTRSLKIVTPQSPPHCMSVAASSNYLGPELIQGNSHQNNHNNHTHYPINTNSLHSSQD